MLSHCVQWTLVGLCFCLMWHWQQRTKARGLTSRGGLKGVRFPASFANSLPLRHNINGRRSLSACFLSNSQFSSFSFPHGIRRYHSQGAGIVDWNGGVRLGSPSKTKDRLLKLPDPEWRLVWLLSLADIRLYFHMAFAMCWCTFCAIKVDHVILSYLLLS